MNGDDFLRHYTDWVKDNQNQRLGQYLMNKLEGVVIDSEIFYTKDTKKAYELFLSRWVVKSEKP